MQPAYSFCIKSTVSVYFCPKVFFAVTRKGDPDLAKEQIVGVVIAEIGGEF